MFETSVLAKNHLRLETCTDKLLQPEAGENNFELKTETCLGVDLIHTISVLNIIHEPNFR